MSAKPSTSPNVIGRVASKLARMPEEDVRLVLELVDYLEERQPAEGVPSLSPSRIREEAQRRAALLRDVPREQIVARFRELGEEIRREAMAKGTAIEGDWTGG